MLERYEFKIDSLYCWPQDPICLKTGKIGLFELLLRTTAFEDSHGRKEAPEIDRSKERLIGQNSSCDGGVVVPEIDLFLQELIPFGGSRPKYRSPGQLGYLPTSSEHIYLPRRGPYVLIEVDHGLRTLSSLRPVAPRYRPRQTAPKMKS